MVTWIKLYHPAEHTRLALMLLAATPFVHHYSSLDNFYTGLTGFIEAIAGLVLSVESITMDYSIRFSELVRKGLRFRKTFERAKRSVTDRDFAWYSYDSFSTLFFLQQLLNEIQMSFSELVDAKPILDVGAADGGLSSFLNLCGFLLNVGDNSGTNINQMKGIHALAKYLNSTIDIRDSDLDQHFEISGQYGICMFLGVLYHLTNPFYALEKLAHHSLFCFLSTRVARFSSNKAVRLDGLPVSYLLGPAECNNDSTNYWIFFR